jgi:hypothetical protein
MSVGLYWIDTKMSGVHMLAFVSKILLDWRFEELKLERELLSGPTHYKQKWPMHSKHLIRVCFKMQWKGLELLALTSKAFMDTRLLEFKKENEQLKLKRFWKIYGVNNLRKQLRAYQWRIGAVHCECVSCKKYKRFDPLPKNGWDEVDLEDARYYANQTWDVCKYRPWFHELLNDVSEDVGKIGIEHVYFKGNNVEWFWGYGPKFYNARSVADPELRKLEGIFDTLYYMQKFK